MTKCACNQLQSCPACSAACACDVGRPCESCSEKPFPTREQVAAKFGPPDHSCEIDDGTSCEKCCEHGDTEDNCCLDCGKDLFEDRMAAAYDRMKDRD
jgi:hypothetical protein